MLMMSQHHKDAVQMSYGRSLMENRVGYQNPSVFIEDIQYMRMNWVPGFHLSVRRRSCDGMPTSLNAWSWCTCGGRCHMQGNGMILSWRFFFWKSNIRPGNSVGDAGGRWGKWLHSKFCMGNLTPWCRSLKATASPSCAWNRRCSARILCELALWVHLGTTNGSLSDCGVFNDISPESCLCECIIGFPDPYLTFIATNHASS